MKHAKTLGLLAVAALAVMAFVGVSSAAAAKVCSTSGTGTACASGHGSELTTQALKASSTGTRSVRLTSGFATVECDSSISGESTHAGAGKITSLTFTNCTSNLGECSSATANASSTNPYTVATTASGGGNGAMIVTAIPITGQFTCGGVTCKYTASEAGGANGTLAVTGSDTAPTVAASGIKLKKEEGSSFLCSSEATWEGNYAVTSPTSLWIE